MPDLLDSFGVAVLMNIQLRAVWRLVEAGSLHPVVVEPGVYRFLLVDVLEYMAKGQKEQPHATHE